MCRYTCHKLTQRVKDYLHSFLTSALNTRRWSASRPSRFALRYSVQYQWNRTLGGPGAALDILRKDKILGHAVIQTPVSPSTSPVNTPTTLCRFHSTLAAGLLKCQINYPARNPKVSRIGLLTFGTVQVRKQFFIYILLTVHLITVFVNNQLDAQFFFLYLFIPILYMFRTTKCSSSGQPIVSI